ncbi:MAG: hypothetical protein FWF72_00525 [Paludibacter sp.]|nr:hypothetical protein [Paludibacter sp.]
MDKLLSKNSTTVIVAAIAAVIGVLALVQLNTLSSRLGDDGIWKKKDATKSSFLGLGINNLVSY